MMNKIVTVFVKEEFDKKEISDDLITVFINLIKNEAKKENIEWIALYNTFKQVPVDDGISNYTSPSSTLIYVPRPTTKIMGGSSNDTIFSLTQDCRFIEVPKDKTVLTRFDAIYRLLRDKTDNDDNCALHNVIFL